MIFKMTQIDKLIKGLEIIRKYDPDSDFAAEHDEFFCGSSDKIPAEVKVELEELGWYESDYDSMVRYC